MNRNGFTNNSRHKTSLLAILAEAADFLRQSREENRRTPIILPPCGDNAQPPPLVSDL